MTTRFEFTLILHLSNYPRPTHRPTSSNPPPFPFPFPLPPKPPRTPPQKKPPCAIPTTQKPPIPDHPNPSGLFKPFGSLSGTTKRVFREGNGDGNGDGDGDGDVWRWEVQDVVAVVGLGGCNGWEIPAMPLFCFPWEGACCLYIPELLSLPFYPPAPKQTSNTKIQHPTSNISTHPLLTPSLHCSNPNYCSPPSPFPCSTNQTI